MDLLISELTKIVECNGLPALLTENNNLVALNERLHHLLFSALPTPGVTMLDIEMQIAGLSAAIKDETSLWACPSTIGGAHWAVVFTRFQNSVSPNSVLTIAVMQPLVWAGAPLGITSNWLVALSDVAQATQYPLLVNMQSQRVSIPTVTATAVGLTEVSSVPDWLERVHPNDRDNLSTALTSIETERWRTDELLEIQLFNR